MIYYYYHYHYYCYCYYHYYYYYYMFSPRPQPFGRRVGRAAGAAALLICPIFVLYYAYTMLILCLQGYIETLLIRRSRSAPRRAGCCRP